MTQGSGVLEFFLVAIIRYRLQCSTEHSQAYKCEWRGIGYGLH